MRLVFDLAGLRVALNLPSEELGKRLLFAFAAFQTEATPSVVIDARLTKETLPASFAPGLRPLPELSGGEGYVLKLWGEGYRAEVSADRAQASIELGSEIFPLDALLKVLLADWLAVRGGLLIHGVSLAHGERAALFTGPSGAGKSTLGAVASAGGLTLLADELCAVLPDERGGFEVRATPWNVGKPMRAGLALMGTLAWGMGHSLEPLAAGELLRVLLPNALLPDVSAAGRAAMFRRASELIERTRLAKLRFAREPGVSTLLAHALEQE